MAEKVSRQTGHCRAGEAGWLGWVRLLLSEAMREAGGEARGDSVRSMVSSSLLEAVGETWDWLAGSSISDGLSYSVVSSISMSSSCSSVSGGL